MNTEIRLIAALIALSVACGDDDSSGTELSAAECSNGTDDDGDGLSDCADVACSSHSFCGADSGATPDAMVGLGCGMLTCGGCCSDGECIQPTSIDACGINGSACERCNDDEACTAGQCVSSGCSPSSCDGCCEGDTCRPGNATAACGVRGAACEACTSGEMCLPAGSCGIDPGSLWDVVVVDGTLPPQDAMTMGAWDALGGAPDPFVVVQYGSDTATTMMSPRVDDVFTATWNHTIATNVRADELLAYLRFDLYDFDPDANDWAGACVVRSVAPGFSGAAQTLTCPPDSMSHSSGFTLHWKLMRH